MKREKERVVSVIEYRVQSAPNRKSMIQRRNVTRCISNAVAITDINQPARYRAIGAQISGQHSPVAGKHRRSLGAFAGSSDSRISCRPRANYKGTCAEQTPYRFKVLPAHLSPSLSLFPLFPRVTTPIYLFALLPPAVRPPAPVYVPSMRAKRCEGPTKIPAACRSIHIDERGERCLSSMPDRSVAPVSPRTT